jgi:hypothetical protein
MNTKFIFLVAAVSLALSITMTIASSGVVDPVVKEVAAQQLGDQEFDARLMVHPKYLWFRLAPPDLQNLK